MNRLDVALYVGIALLAALTVFGVLHGASPPAAPDQAAVRSVGH